MKSDFFFRHMETSEALQEYANRKLERLDKFAFQPHHVLWVFFQEREEAHVELIFKGTSDREACAKASGREFREAVDLVIEKMAHQIERSKAKKRDRNRQAARKMKRSA